VKVREQDIAATVVAWLEDCGHDVYQEVECIGGVADIVTLSGPRQREVSVVEVKTGWSLDLLEQCVSRRRIAHRVWAAVPHSKADHSILFAEFGIGVLVVTPEERMGRYVIEARIAARFHAGRVSGDRRHGADLKRRLRPEHKTHAKAGAPGAGGRYTPFAATCRALRDVVEAQPGISIKDAVAATDHHYASVRSAISSLRTWIDKGVVEGVRLDAGHLYPVSVGKRGAA
jgi:hypothetical protein